MKAVLILLILSMLLSTFQVWRFNEQNEKMIVKNNYIENGKVKYTQVFTANLPEACVGNN
jgi:hypothetical protein